MKTVQDRVKQLMSIYPETRNNDQLLVIKYWNTYYGVDITRKQAKRILDSEAIVSIVRARSHIQNTEGKLEASPEVKKKRKGQEDRYRATYTPIPDDDFYYRGGKNFK